MKPNNETPPPILHSGIQGSPLTTTIAGYVSVVLPERSGYQDTIVQADMMAQLARYGLTFGDIKEGNRFEVQTEGWIPGQGSSTQGGSTLTFTINALGSFVLDSHVLGGTEGTYTAGDLSPIYLGNPPPAVVHPDGTFISGTQFDYITSGGRMRRFADNHATPKIVGIKKL